MNDRRFSLAPFPSARSLPPVTIEGAIARRGGTLAIRYTLNGRLGDVVIPEPTSFPERQNGLWQDTCFEFFLAVRGSPPYWEFNLSPAGHWNVYRFSCYREGMEEERDFSSLPFRVERQSESLSLSLELHLDRIAREDQVLEVAASAVIRQRDGSVTYWALTHPGPKPDFHQRESFVVAL
ncbi:MAG: DOMON-like domain-containing protein [Nitrospirota bacterium]